MRRRRVRSGHEARAGHKRPGATLGQEPPACCSDDAQCSYENSATPYCNKGDAAYGPCVECLVDADGSSIGCGENEYCDIVKMSVAINQNPKIKHIVW